MNPKILLKHLGPRQAWSHKGQHGRLLVVGGSYLYTGSPVFNALAAYRTGCDIVKIVSPEKAALTIRSYSPDLIAYPLKGDYISQKHVKQILKLQKVSDAMIIGGGLGREKQTVVAVKTLLKKTAIPTVVDADALYALPSKLGKNFLLTPNTKEFQAITKKKLTTNVNQRKTQAKALALKLGCTVLLKGHVDVITDDTRTEKNNTGCPEMAKAGAGDILAGVCGALLARKFSVFDAACLASYLNGRAGSLAAKKYGEGLKATDIVNALPNAITSARR